MTFLNMALLLALGAIAVPVILHLLNRRHAEVVDWGATQFLRATVTSRKRRVLLEELILMLLRVLLIALPVLALARPFLPAGPASAGTAMLPMVLPAMLLAVMAVGAAATLWREKMWRWILLGAGVFLLAVSAGLLLVGERLGLGDLGKAGDQDVVIIVDASTSMTAEVDGQSNFDRAVASARSIVEALPGSSSVGIILGAPVPDVKTPTPLHDRVELANVLKKLAPVRGHMAPRDCLRAAGAVLARGRNAAKRIVVLTDQQKLGWDADNAVSWRAVAETLRQLPVEPQIVVHRFPLPAPAGFRNLAAASIRLSREVVGPDRAVGIDVRVENTGAQPIAGAQVQLEVDGQTVATVPAGLAPAGGGQATRFSHLFTRPGAHVIRARVLAEDLLPSDNVCESAVLVAETLPVLVVDGNPAPGPLERASAYAALALSPESEAGRTPFVTPEVLDVMMVQKVENFSRYRVVILADVPQLPGPIAQRLARFVTEGGGLLIAPGRGANAEFYNGWRSDRGEAITPGALGARWSVPPGGGAPAKADLGSFHHRALDLFGAGKGGDVGTAIFTSYWRMVVPEGSPQITVAARLDSGDPLLAERRLGRGVVLMTAVPLDASAGNLTSRQSFLPLVHELTYYLADAGAVKLDRPPGRESVLYLESRAGGAGGGAKTGLRGDYYNGPAFETFVFSRVDPLLNLSWPGSPGGNLTPDNISIRWTGTITPPDSGTYTFELEHDDGGTLWIGRKAIAAANGAGTGRGTIEMVGGRKYELRAELVDRAGPARIALYWSTPGRPRRIVPGEWLSPRSKRQTDQTAQVFLPTGQWRDVKLTRQGSSARVGLGTLAGAGLYRLKLPAGLSDLTRALAADDGTIPFTITYSVAESRLEKLPDEELASLKSHLQLFPVSTQEELLACVTQRGPGEELWKFLAVAALVLVLAEVALTRWIAGGRRTHAWGAVEFDQITGNSAEALRRKMAALKEALPPGDDQSPAA